MGLFWGSTGYNLRNDGHKCIAPAEGAFAAPDFVPMKNATTVDQAHKFATLVSTAGGSAMWAVAFSSNAVGKGSADFIDPDVAAYDGGAFNDEALVKQ